MAHPRWVVDDITDAYGTLLTNSCSGLQRVPETPSEFGSSTQRSTGDHDEC